MNIIEIIIYAIVFTLCYHVLGKAVSRVDEFLKKKMNDKLYNTLIWSIVIATYALIIYATFK